MDKTPSIVIAGGGIGGLAAALACAAAGLSVRVLERAPSPATAGAGIQITPNAGHVLAELGLEDAIAANAAEPESIDIHSWRGGRIVRLPLGRRFAKRYRLPYRTIHRADLLHALVEAAGASPQIELMFGWELVEFALHPHGLTVLAHHDGTHRELAADALIGADGIGSFVRSVMPQGRPRVATGRSAWRAVITAENAPESLLRDRVGLWLGRSGHVVHYPVRGGKEFNIVVVSDDAPDFDELRRRMRRWAVPVTALLDLEADWQRWPIGTVKPTGPWRSGPVALLGDAAHAMAPYLAQGGAMAIEDAAVIARELAASPGDVAGALARYEAARKRRVTRIWRAAHRTADLYHMGALTGGMRNIVMRILGGAGLAWRYAWIYRWRPPAGKTRRPEAARATAKDAVVS